MSPISIPLHVYSVLIYTFTGLEDDCPSPIAPLSVEDSSLEPARVANSPLATANSAAVRARPSMAAGFKGNIALSGSRRSVIRRESSIMSGIEDSSPPVSPSLGDKVNSDVERSAVAGPNRALAPELRNESSDESSDISLPIFEDHEVKKGPPQLERRNIRASSQSDANTIEQNVSADNNDGSGNRTPAMPALNVDTKEDKSTSNPPSDGVLTPAATHSSPSSWRRASINTESRTSSPNGESNWRRASIASPACKLTVLCIL